MIGEKQDIQDLVELRRIKPKDRAFIFSSWLRSFRDAPFAKNISNTIYFEHHHELIERLLDESEVIIACDKNDPDTICGFICAQMIDGIFTIHYIYTKHTYRRLGIGEYLLNAFEHDTQSLGCYTHHNKIANKLAAKYNLVYHPYLMAVMSNTDKPVLDEQ